MAKAAHNFSLSELDGDIDDRHEYCCACFLEGIVLPTLDVLRSMDVDDVRLYIQEVLRGK